MTHLLRKRLPGSGRTLAAVLALVAALALGTAGEASASTGGAGGERVTVTDRAAVVPVPDKRFSGPPEQLRPR
ncbi:hypothetical protein SAM40697_1768 [Streptomyces ambofaciens]|uniref:Secreted protein n=1 Tax=Streptomyces ambofaciens TaxID=1889 RepID=A0ABN4P6P1_STRAM|nr:hypothetical protein [Streptomyces ambofaciens]ANB05728.1 hypothetical protein SAM40697_1768 [Streptomyces ambofaciens]